MSFKRTTKHKYKYRNMEDREAADLALAIQRSLKDEKKRRKREEAAMDVTLPLLQLVHCEKTLFALPQAECSDGVADPLSCPLCKEPLCRKEQAAQSNKVLRSPFGPSRGRALVIKPTHGSFASRNYSTEALLHCGISDSSGAFVFNFDQNGIRKEVWNTASSSAALLSVVLVGEEENGEEKDEELKTQEENEGQRLRRLWDEQLEKHLKEERRRVAQKPYHALKNNCYDFVIRFLNAIEFEGKKNHTKEDIVGRYLSTPVDTAESYLHIRRTLTKAPLYVQE
ncbi:MKRN2 opposite strand [Balamuthia mandrillaris]